MAPEVVGHKLCVCTTVAWSGVATGCRPGAGPLQKMAARSARIIDMVQEHDMDVGARPVRTG
jgi:hypothetical protein